MTLSPDSVHTLTHKIDGWLDPGETRYLYTTALGVPVNGIIVEIGTYRGRSTTVLALAAQACKARVYTIDPYEGDMDGRTVTLHDRDYAMHALEQNGVRNVVEFITAPSLDIAETWDKPIDLLFIDGSHFYEDVKADLEAWTPHVRGLIAMHDTNPDGEWKGVVQALDELIAEGEWRVIARVDATTVLERVE